MRYLFYILTALGCAFVWSGCGGFSKPPSWYGKNAQEDRIFVGFGSAKSLDSAKANALNDIITQMKVQVSSQYSSSTQRKDSSLSYTSRSDVYLDNAGIELSDVRYVRDDFSNNQYYVEAQIPKSSLVAQFKRSFDKEYNALNVNKISQCQSLSIKDKLRLESALNNLHTYAAFLQSLGLGTKSLAPLETLLSKNSPLPTARLIIESNMPNEIVSSDLAKELGNFYSFDSEANNLIKIKLQLHNKSNQLKIYAVMSIYDCRNNPVYTTNVSYIHNADNTDESLRFVSSRISVMLYKKIQEWIEQ